MKLHQKYFLSLLFLLYVVLTLCSIYYVFYYSSQYELSVATATMNVRVDHEPILSVEVWSKAAVGIYLWKHILGAAVEGKAFRMHGSLVYNQVSFKFRSGPDFAIEAAPKTVQNLVLILNGRDKSKLTTCHKWLQFLDKLPELKTTVVIILGSEDCENEWLYPYLRQQGGCVDAVFVTYDATEVDDQTWFQWPLGVATYRDFPLLPASALNLALPRRYICSFSGTIYRNSTRESFLKHVNSLNECQIIPRYEWSPTESVSSRKAFVDQILQSDLTLCPAGFNIECYRIYEAFSLGSVPVLMESSAQAHCSERDASGPLRLLKRYGAPIIELKSWNQLESLITQEKKLVHSMKIKRRVGVIKWYEKFKGKMKNLLVRVIKRIASKHYNITISD